MTKKIKADELSKLQNLVTTLQTVQSQIGKLETQKHILIHQFDMVGQKINELKAELKGSYGDIDIDFITVEYTIIKNIDTNKND